MTSSAPSLGLSFLLSSLKSEEQTVYFISVSILCVGRKCVLCDLLLCRADLDPIYYCELLKACPIKDDGDAKITSVTVTPKSGPQGEWSVAVCCGGVIAHSSASSL